MLRLSPTSDKRNNTIVVVCENDAPFVYDVYFLELVKGRLEFLCFSAMELIEWISFKTKMGLDLKRVEKEGEEIFLLWLQKNKDEAANRRTYQ